MSPHAARLGSSLCAVAVLYLALGRHGLAPAGPAVDDSSVAQALVRTAAARVAEGRFADALEPALDVVKAYPGNHVYLEQLATIYGRLHRPGDEAAVWERFIEASPTPENACPSIVEAYRVQGLTHRAADASNRCLTFTPDDPDMMFYAARSAEWMAQWDRAADLYGRALALDNRNLDVQMGLARVTLHRGDPADALRQAGVVLATAPTAVDALLIAGLASLQLQRREEARRYFERGLTVKESYPDLHIGLGRLDEDEHRLQTAREHYERALAIDPTRADAREQLTRVVSSMNALNGAARAGSAAEEVRP